MIIVMSPFNEYFLYVYSHNNFIKVIIIPILQITVLETLTILSI